MFPTSQRNAHLIFQQISEHLEGTMLRKYDADKAQVHKYSEEASGKPGETDYLSTLVEKPSCAHIEKVIGL